MMRAVSIQVGKCRDIRKQIISLTIQQKQKENEMTVAMWLVKWFTRRLLRMAIIYRRLKQNLTNGGRQIMFN